MRRLILWFSLLGVLFYWLSNDHSVATIQGELLEHDVTLLALQPGKTWIYMFGAGRMDSVEVMVH